MKRKLEIESVGGQRGEINPWNGKAYSSSYYSLLSKRKQLPVYEFKEQLEAIVEKNQVVIIEGETGSGKTTQIPQFLLGLFSNKRCLVGCTQPRRVAGNSLFLSTLL
jgi:pre-mRNA-splicing factor ATP-dependent RNA helicase DHX15/PRP43